MFRSNRIELIRTVTEVFSEPSQTSKMEAYESRQLAILAKTPSLMFDSVMNGTLSKKFSGKFC